MRDNKIINPFAVLSITAAVTVVSPFSPVSDLPDPFLMQHDISGYYEKMDTNQKDSRSYYSDIVLSQNDNMRTLLDIQNLEPNWNGYGGKEFSLEVISLARDIVIMLGKYQPEIYPTGRGTVQMQYELADRSYLEFEIYSDRIEVLEVPKRIYENAKESTIPAEQCYKTQFIVKDFLHQSQEEDTWTTPSIGV